MKIALVHSYYSSKQPSGENVVVDAQHAALLSAGHEVLVVRRDSDDIERGNLLDFTRVAVRVATGRGGDPTQELADFGPDIVHVHNLFPNFGTAWLSKWKTPIVATLHNFRASCAAGTLYRAGSECTECVARGSHRALKHRCYRDSLAATLPLAIANRGGATHNPLIIEADRLIVLSSRAQRIHETTGVPAEKLVQLPNFVGDAPHSFAYSSENPWVYIGRLSPEKGVQELIRAWPDAIPLRIVGDGPLREWVLENLGPRMEYAGSVPRTQIPEILRNSRGLVFPSQWAESAVPLSYVEALVAARPVIAWHANGAADDVLSGGTGVVIQSWAELSGAIGTISDGWDYYSRQARQHFEANYSEARWVSRVTSIYESIAAGNPSQQA